MCEVPQPQVPQFVSSGALPGTLPVIDSSIDINLYQNVYFLLGWLKRVAPYR